MNFLFIPFLSSGRHLLFFPYTRSESLSTLLLPSGPSCLLFFLESNSILSPCQAGFLPERSTLDQFLFLFQSILDGFNKPRLSSWTILPPASFSPLTLSGFFNGMLKVFEPEALNYFTFFHPILLTLSASRNPILTHLPLSGFIDSLLCVLIAPTHNLAFFLLMPHTLGWHHHFRQAGPIFL